MRRGLVVVAMVGLVAIVGAACGAGGEDGEGRERPLLPSLAAAGGGAQRDAAALTTGGAAADESASTAAFPARPVEYRLRDGLAVDESSAAAYRIEADAVDEDDVRRLAAALGVAGGVRDAEGQLMVGSGDRNVAVDRSTGRWWLNAESAVRSDTVTACAPDGRCDDPAPPKPLPDLPTKDEVLDAARAFAREMGLDNAEVAQVDGDESYGWSVTITPRVGGRLARGLETYLTYGSKATVIGGGGAIAAPAKIGDYPLASVREAFERVKAAGGGWAPYPLVDRDAGAAADAVGGGVPGSTGSAGGSTGSAGAATDTGAPAQVAPEGSGGTGGTGGAEPAPPEDAEPMPMPTPDPGRGSETTLAPEVVVLDEARLVLSVAYPMCPGDATYLVPMYELTGGDHVVPALAVQDEDVQDAPGAGPGVAGADRAACEIPPGKEGESVPPSPGVTDGGSPPVTG